MAGRWRRLRALLVNQFYPPDMAPTGQHLHDLARRLVKRGHRVDVLCARRSYDGGGDFRSAEVLDGVQVRRVGALGFGRKGAARAADYVSFLGVAGLGSALRRDRYDLTLCLTTPPYVGWVLPRALGARAGAVAQWVMDLYPDVLCAHGSLSAGGLAERLLASLARAQMARSRLVLSLGSRMERRVRPYLGASTRSEAVPLWTQLVVSPAQEQAAHEWRGARGWRGSDVVFLYSGNMGLGHRVGEFVEAARRLASRDDVVFAFAGGGRRRAEVEAAAGSLPAGRLRLLPYVPQADLSASLRAADVHLVSLRTPWQGLIVPSKLQAAFGLGRPVVFVGPEDCEPADWIRASGGGWIVPEGDVDALLVAVAEAMDEPERRRRGAAALGFAREHFDPARNIGRIVDLLEEAADPIPGSDGRPAEKT